MNLTEKLRRHRVLWPCHTAGFTSKEENLYDTYFPLDYGGGIPYFTDDVQATQQTGYIVSFCADALTGTSDVGSMRSDLNAWLDGEGHLHIVGLSPGKHHITVCDVAGRMVLDRQVNADAMSARLDWPQEALGLYIVKEVGAGSVRLINR